MSFRRRTTTTTGPQTQQRPAVNTELGLKHLDQFNLVLTSTGIPSLDDVLGGGLALTSVFTILDSNVHSAYADLVLKHFIAQGIFAQHKIILIDLSGDDLLQKCPWIRTESSSSSPASSVNRPDVQPTDLVQIAWRYQYLKQFSTTIEKEDNLFCQPFDLSCQMPTSVLDAVKASEQLILISHASPTNNMLDHVMQEIAQQISESSSTNDFTPVRICIRDLGSLDWGELSGTLILRFFHSLRSLLKSYPTSCAIVKPATQWSDGSYYNDDTWLHKLASLSDNCITFSGNAGNPALEETLPDHHGILTIHSLQTGSSYISPSDRYSRLRGLSRSGSGGSGENNLAFKCTRKRMVIETLHLDVEGGVGERKTVRPDSEPSPHLVATTTKMHHSSVPIGIGHEQHVSVSQDCHHETEKKKLKRKKGVAFRVDQPDLYDF